MSRHTYWGLAMIDGRIAELEIVREGGRQVSQSPTGRTWGKREARAAEAENARRNREEAR